MRRWVRRIAGGCLVIVVLTLVAAFALLHVVSGDREIPGVARASQRVSDTQTISYVHAGNDVAPRIVFVHGSPGSATAWADFLTNPIPGFETIAVDRIGFGKSQPRAPLKSLAAEARALEPFLVERNGRWPILVGHSLGGSIICQAAVEFPEKIGGLVIVSGALSPALEKVYWYQDLAEFAFVPALLPESIRNSNRELIPLKEQLEALAPRLGELALPVTILHGAKDMLVPVKNVEYMRGKFTRVSNLVVTILPDENHFIPWTRDDAIRDAVRAMSEAMDQK